MYFPYSLLRKKWKWNEVKCDKQEEFTLKSEQLTQSVVNEINTIF